MKAKKVLTKRREFVLVYSRGTSIVGGLVVMKALANELGLLRYGLVTSRRVGKAVARNRLRRRLRESLRKLPLKSGWDIVFIARPAAAAAKYADIDKELKRLLSKARLLVENDEENCLSPN